MKLITNPNMYFHQALGICQEFPPYNKLTGKELQVLGELMMHKHSGFKPLLNTKVRVVVAERLKISQESLRNNLVQLRIKGLLVEDEIPEKYLIKYLQPFQFEFYDKG